MSDKNEEKQPDEEKQYDQDVGKILGAIFGDSLWPKSFKFENFQYDISNSFDARRKILCDMNLVMGNLMVGILPPIDVRQGFSTCIKALSDIMIKEITDNEEKK